MHRSHLALAAALMLAAFEVGSSVPLQNLPGVAIRSCLTELGRIAEAEGHPDSHSFDLHTRCPDLATGLGDSLHEADSGVIDSGATSVEGLRDLESFAEGFRQRPPAVENVSLDFDGLDALLADVLVEQQADDGLWERFLRWLDGFVKDGDSVEFRRFVDWLEGLELPPWVADTILKVCVVLIVLLALIVIGNEIRLSGLLRGRRLERRATVSPGAAPAAHPPRARSLDELRDLPPRELAAAVLEIVIKALAERGWLSASASRTNGELVSQIGQRRAEMAAPFTGLVGGVEKILYGDRLPDDATRQRLVTSAREIVERARGAAPASPVSAQ